MIEFVSLGSDCCVAYQLRKNGYRKSSYPFDWIRSSLETCLRLIEYNFGNFLDKSDIYHTRISANYKFIIEEFSLEKTDFDESEKEVEQGYIFKSFLYKDLEFCHDFIDNSASNLKEIQEKYSRRICKLYDILSEDSEKKPVFIHYTNKQIPRDILEKWNSQISKPLYIITPASIEYPFSKLEYIEIVRDYSIYDSWQRNNFDWSKLFHNILFKSTLDTLQSPKY